MIIHTFGDSHSEFGWKYLGPNIQIHHLGPKLCFSFGRDKLSLCNITSHVKEGDSVVFCFGEIDCRCHVNRYTTKMGDYKLVIDDIIKKYIEAIELNIKDYKNINIIIYNVVPPEKGHTNNIDNDRLGSENVFHHYMGSDEDRQHYHIYFNEQLEIECKKRNYKFLNVYKDYSTEEGFLNTEYSDKSIHIQNPIFILNKLNEFFPDMNFTSSYSSSIVT